MKNSRERRRETDRRWYRNNIEKCKAKRRRYYKDNRELELSRAKQYNRENRKRISARDRLSRRNMTQEQHDDLLLKQHNCCAICGKPFIETPRIDHNHETDENRGLLCNYCNTLIGMCFESIEILGNAIQYLKGYQNESNY